MKHQRPWTYRQLERGVSLTASVSINWGEFTLLKLSSANQHWHSDTNTSGQTACQNRESSILFEHLIVITTK